MGWDPSSLAHQFRIAAENFFSGRRIYFTHEVCNKPFHMYIIHIQPGQDYVRPEGISYDTLDPLCRGLWETVCNPHSAGTMIRGYGNLDWKLEPGIVLFLLY